MQPDRLDQRADVRLRMREPERHAVRPQSLREARQVDHQRRVRERQLAQIHDYVTRRVQGRGERPPASTAGRPVLIPRDAEDGELCVEGDDRVTLQRTARFVQVTNAEVPTLVVEMIQEDDVLEALSNLVSDENSGHSQPAQW